ncbi:ABC transporter ATP-binding protein [Paenibacillus sp. NPDC056722]|uniref:ABC transporter ATP-binding protein n=1 Tax=Paenibacillus sp. NPDC056722 TaxID=3345924 RepID=UPI0036A34B97
MTEVLVEIDNLSKYFTVRSGWFGASKTLHAVDNVSLSLHKGECFGLVGESGCGKSTLSRTLLQLYAPTSGTIRIAGSDISSVTRRVRRRNTRNVQMVFQDSYWSMNPKLRVGDVVGEPLRTHTKLSAAERNRKVAILLEQVGLPADFARRFPSQLSGGQRQRIGIARAIALQPELLILDEPTSALDMSVQAQILNLLKDLQEEQQLTYLFVSHDLSVVRHMCTRMAVMYLGQIVETGTTEQIFAHPLHPYTRMLMQAVPDIEGNAELTFYDGEMPKAIDPPVGCRFASRCPHVTEKCTQENQSLRELDGDRSVRCHLAM